MAIVTIIGSGMMGSALAFPARENGNIVRLVGSPLDDDIIDFCRKNKRHPKFNREFPDGIEYYQISELNSALCGSDLVIGGVSSFGVEWFGKNILPVIPRNVPVLTVTKGLMDTRDGKLLTYPELWQKMDERNRNVSLNAVGGPCTSYELVQHDHTEVAFCGKDMEVLEMIRNIMETDYYHISLSTDVTGIESAVALKNAYALAVALTIGVNQKERGIDSELHFNSQAAVFGQSMKEMKMLLDIQGAGGLDNLAVGVGDLYVTVYGGRTRQIGILLGRGLNIDEATEKLEGVTLESLVVAERVGRAVKCLSERGLADLGNFPLLMHVYSILVERSAVCIPWDSFRFKNV